MKNVFEYNVGWFPSIHTFHAALFMRGEGYSTTTGQPNQIVVFDQFKGSRNAHTPGPRTIRAYTFDQAQQVERVYRTKIEPCDNASLFCVVLVP